MAIEPLEIQDLKDEIFRREDFIRRNPLHKATRQYAMEIPRLKMRLQKATGEEVPGAMDTTEQARARLFSNKADPAQPRNMPPPHESETVLTSDDADGAVGGPVELSDADD